MTDREALVAGIAADPDNDLRRLVFADWLEEHGEHERAEFVRLQVETKRLPTSQTKTTPAVQRAEQLYQEHGMNWLGPFLAALDPRLAANCPFTTRNRFLDESGWGFGLWVDYLRVGPGFNAGWLYVQGVTTVTGLPAWVGLDLERRPRDSELAAAFRLEPVEHVSAYTTSLRTQWRAFTDPALRQIRVLTLHTSCTDQAVRAGCEELFHDPNLTAVRGLKLPASDSRFLRKSPVGWSTLRELANSPLGARLTDLHVETDDAGLRELCRWSMPVLAHLVVAGRLSPRGVRLLPTAEFAPRLKSLTLHADLNDRAVRVLAHGRQFRSLTTLDLARNEYTGRGVADLAKAIFLPQLDCLRLHSMAAIDPSLHRTLSARMKSSASKLFSAER